MNSEEPRPRFILVDSSVSGAGGHYLEYAEQVFDAAQGAGFTPVLIANAAFVPGAACRAAAFPVLPLDMWGNNLALRNDRDNVFTDDDRRMLRHQFGRMGVLWAAANNLEAVKHYAREIPLSRMAAKNLGAVCRLAGPVTRAYKAILTRESGDSIPRSHGEERSQRYNAFRRALREVAQQGLAGSGHDMAADDLNTDDMYRHSARAHAYAAAIETVLEEIAVTRDDVVFVPTLSFSEAAAVRNLLARSQTARLPCWCLLFRRDIYRGYTPDWDRQEWNIHPIRNLFASFAHLAGLTRVKFLCDTEELSRQYERLRAGRFTTVAIPVRSGRAAAPKPAPRPTKAYVPDRRIEILYRRDSRSEHGFDYLSLILDALPQELLRRIRFSAAAASALPEVKAGDFRSVLARARLRPYVGGCYRELPEPRLHIDDWRAVMRSLQIVVFVEPRDAHPSLALEELQAAAAAGTIMVLPSETALSAAFDSALAQQHPNSRVFRYSEGASSNGTATNIANAIIAAVKCHEEAASPVVAEPRGWLLCYPGDARHEKGFTLLPNIIDRLFLQVIRGRPICLVAQTYQTSSTFDVEISKCIDKLQRSAPFGNVLIPELLGPDEYSAMMASSDIVYNLYSRENYISRSSGVFVEAIACHKPVIVTAGTWMSALMGAHAAAYHRDTIAPDSVLSAVMRPGADPRWCQIGSENGAHIDRTVPLGQIPQVSQTLGVYQVFARADQANHVWIELEVDTIYPDICVGLTIAWRGGDLQIIQQERAVLNRLGSGVLSVVLEMPRICEDLWLGIDLAHCDVVANLKWLSVRWIDVPSIAYLPGGISVSDGPQNQMVAESMAAITSILINHKAYVASCEWLANRWANTQNANQLVREILEAPGLDHDSGARLSGGDW